MLRDHQSALVWVDACTHDKAFAKSWAFGSNSSKVQALQARCNHPHKHQSIAGVKEQGVYLSTLTAEYPPSLALQLAEIGKGRVSKTGSFRLALPLHSNCQSALQAPHLDGAGMHSSADWCLPKPEHPLQAVARPWLHWMHERKLVPRILAHVNSGSSDCPLSPSESLEAATLAYTVLQLPCPSDMSPEAGQPYRLHLAKSWGDPDADRSRISLASKPSMASKEARLHAAAGSGNL